MEFLKQHIYIILGSLCLLAMGVIFLVNASPFSNVPTGEPIGIHSSVPANSDGSPVQTPVPAVITPAYVVVHVLGAVYAPGVFSLPVDARVVDAVNKAGGYTQEADLMRVNLAAPLVDAMQIIVPAAGDYSVIPAGGDGSGSVPGTVTVPDDGLICLNTATLTELQTLPNIGPARAQSIIDYRESAGGFTRVEELLNISGIGNTIFGRLEPLVTVR